MEGVKICIFVSVNYDLFKLLPHIFFSIQLFWGLSSMGCKKYPVHALNTIKTTIQATLVLPKRFA